MIQGGKVPICMHQYKFLFGWTRIPKKDADIVVCPGGFPSKTRHILILFRNQIFALNVYDENYRRFSIQDLET